MTKHTRPSWSNFVSPGESATEQPTYRWDSDEYNDNEIETDSSDEKSVRFSSRLHPKATLAMKVRRPKFLNFKIRLKGKWLRRRVTAWTLLILLIFAIIAYLHNRSNSRARAFEPYWTDEYDKFAFSDHLDQEASAHNNFDNNEFVFGDNIILSGIDAPFQYGCNIPDVTAPRADAALVVLARNSELEGVIKLMKSLERHFNQWYNYPWVFLNNEEFTEEFKETVQMYTSSEVEFGSIPEKEWEFNESVDTDEFKESVDSQGDRTILYGNLPSYHKMCRFYSGFFYKHELVVKRKWYWRVEPDVEFFCDITYDPFIQLEEHNKKYGFNVMIRELYYTVPGLFRETMAYIKKNGIQVRGAWNLFIKDSKWTRGGDQLAYDGISQKRDILRELEDNIALKKFRAIKKKKERHVQKLPERLLKKLAHVAEVMPRLHEDRMNREDYNLCHFWSNFEIARTDLFTDKVYEDYFRHLDDSGGFYKERWGDAPVHSLAVGMMLELKEIHYFRDIGYRHSTLGHCPGNARKNQLRYVPSEKYYKTDLEEDLKWLEPDKPTKYGVGCRCRCPPEQKEIENSGASCIRDWVEVTANDYRAFRPVDLDYWGHEMEVRMDEYLLNGGKLGYSNLADAMLKEV